MKNVLYFSLCILLFLASCKTEPTAETSKNNWKRTSNEVIIRLNSSPAKLHPALVTLANERVIINQVFSLLVDQDPYTYEDLPYLIKALPTQEDITTGPFVGGEVFSFEIREEAIWSDGEPVTGHDFEFTVKSIFTPTVASGRIRSYWSLIKDIQVDESNPKNFKVFTSRKDLDAVAKIGALMVVLPKHIYDAEGLLNHLPCKDFLDKKKIAALGQTDESLQTFAKKFTAVKFSRDPAFIIGCGPYKMISWSEGEKIVLDKIEDWWGNKYTSANSSFSAGPDRLIYKPIVDNVTTISALRSEEIDVADGIDPKAFVSLRADDKYNKIYDFETPPFFGYYFLSLNTRQSKLADKKIRQALAHAIDVNQIIDVLFDGLGTPMAVPIIPSSKFLNKDLKLRTFDIEKAKQLLKEAGWEDSNGDGIVDKEIEGEHTELELILSYVGKSSRQKNLVLLCLETAKEAGIKIIAKAMDGKLLNQSTSNGDFDIAVKGRNWDPVTWHPEQNWHTEGAGETGFGDEVSDELVDRISSELDEEKRIELQQELQAIIYEECPEVYLLNPTSRVVVHKRFKWKPSSMVPGYFPNEFILKE